MSPIYEGTVMAMSPQGDGYPIFGEQLFHLLQGLQQGLSKKA